MNLDKIHHIAVQVADISKSVEWYQTKFSCEVDYVDSSWALLKVRQHIFGASDKERTSTSLRNRADSISEFGEETRHRDGTKSVYIATLITIQLKC